MGKPIVSKVKELRERMNLSQSQLARAIEVTETTVRNWEHGRTGVEWFERIAKLCKTLDCSPSDLFEEQDLDTEESAIATPVDKSTGKRKKKG